MLGQHIVTNPVYEGAQLLRAREPLAMSQNIENAKEGFLPNVFDGLRGSQAPAEFDQEQFAEVSREVALDFSIAAGEASNVLRGELS
jgi:hypothetical protein